MLSSAEIDAVAVVVRVPLHHDITIDALNAGKHVLTEWPLGANLQEAEERLKKYECYDWWFCHREVGKEDVEKAKEFITRIAK